MWSEFTLDLSPEAVRLLYDWNGQPCVLGDVTPSSRKLVEEMAELLSLACQISRPPIVTTIVIPRGLVLYRTMKLDTDRAATEQQVIGHICKETKLTVDDLCVDWVQEEAEVRIAAIEVLTLMEAAKFAEGHGFVPHIVTSHAPKNRFPRKPRFDCLIS